MAESDSFDAESGFDEQEVMEVGSSVVRWVSTTLKHLSWTRARLSTPYILRSFYPNSNPLILVCIYFPIILVAILIGNCTVVLRGVRFNYTNVKISVQQGSLLGPLIFILYNVKKYLISFSKRF